MRCPMFWHIDSDIVSFLVVLALYVYQARFQNKTEKRFLDKRFSQCIQIGLFLTVIDIVASVIMDVPVSRFVYQFGMTLYFVTVELVIVEWFLYAATLLYPDDEKSFRRIHHFVVGVYVAYALFEASNPWTGVAFTLGPNNEYTRGPFFMLMVVVYALYTVALLALILIRRKHIPSEYPWVVLALVPIVLAVAIIVQLTNYGWLTIMPGYMFCLVLAFLFFQTVQTKDRQKLMLHLHEAAETDQLTGLLNRMGMEERIRLAMAENPGAMCLLVIVDIDDLKTINDTMGHGEGDRAIQAVAGQLRNHFRLYDIVARFGGDEFLVFLTGALNETLIHRSLGQLVDEIGGLRIGQQNRVPIHSSVGAACGTVGTDTFDILCRDADAALYHVKRSGKNGFAIFRPGMEREFLREKTGQEKPVC